MIIDVLQNKIQVVSGTAATVAVSRTNVRVVATAACFISTTGTATVSDMLLPANTVQYLRVPNGTLSVIGTSGNLHIAEF